jgi:hypothetical protein
LISKGVTGKEKKGEERKEKGEREKKEKIFNWGDPHFPQFK